MATRKKPVKKKTAAVAPKRRRSTRTTTTTRRVKKGPGKFANFVMPLFFILCMVIGLGFLTVMGYRTATASSFFSARKIDVRGVERSSKEEMEKIVVSQTERTGVWHADLAEIQARIEKLQFVKSAAVSRVLPDGVRVDVTERIPVALIRIGGGDYMVDNEAVLIAPAARPEEKFPFVMRGWDETKTDKPLKENVERVKLYMKMVEEWSNNQLAGRVKELNLLDLSDPKVTIEDSGSNVQISVGKDGYGKHLKAGIEAVAGKGSQVRSVNAAGLYPVFEY